VKTQAHITRKRLEQDNAFGELTLKIEHGIRSQLHGKIEYDVLDDLVQTAWVHLLAQPEKKRTTRLAYLYGAKAAERHWQRSKTLAKHLQDTTVEDEYGEVRDTIEKVPELLPEYALSKAEGLAMRARLVLGSEQYEWLLHFVSSKGFKSLRDNVHAQHLLSSLECVAQ
jgi:hypothetical protein